MAQAVLVHDGTQQDFTADGSLSVGDVIQLPEGLAGVCVQALASGAKGVAQVGGVYRMTKTTGVAILAGGRVYWDRSAAKAHYKKVNDRDYYIGRAVYDAASADSIVWVALNVDPPYDIDLARDAFRTTIVGTQALGGLALNRRGGCHNVIISSTSEAQKVDALGVDGFAPSARAIVEMIFTVPNDGAGTVVDVNLGVANGTHATDADSITEHLFCHLDANNTNINFQSKDGTATTAATDSTTDYTEGSAVANKVEVWLDMRTIASCLLYVNGVQVLSGTTFDMSHASGPLFLLMHVEKSSAADTYELDLHSGRARFQE